MKKYYKISIFLFTLLLISLFLVILQGIHKYFIIKELDLIDRYGSNTYCVITGPSSGQGRLLAEKFAKRGFNLLLIGSKNIEKVKIEIQNSYPNCVVEIIIKDFRRASESGFFKDIEEKFLELDTKISILINNIGYRTGWAPYDKMDPKLIVETISAKAVVQSYLCRLIIPLFLKRKEQNLKSCLINISAQCINPNFLFGFSNEITVPYMSVYEATNAYAFYHSQSLYKEYKDEFDILNITPGAVITSNTGFLKGTIFNVDSDRFTNNIIKFMGNVQGSTCAYVGHAISGYLINLFPPAKDKILKKVGLTISEDYMKNKKRIEDKYNLL
jgi:short-subunit dehydrogenase